ncbi:MAG: Hsp20/alpha crystallin family protein [Fimbriimonadaceae bacterium]|nr:Hsp20/alpha crystallin family protein [Fimbriimonadaceae bacterium]QYK55762.1 MAG: Hsp20/alpha crystallin family protein [Fimbriimonadaceae bacterium]
MSEQDIEELLRVGYIRRIAKEFSSAVPQFARQKEWEPRVDVFELPEFVVVRVELAGVRPEQINLLYVAERRTLVIRGERSEDSIFQQEGVRTHNLEIECGEFYREVVLPEIPLDTENARTQLSIGFLSVVLPKAESKGQDIVLKRVTIHKIR